MAGNTYGNCGKDSQGRYVKCDKRWVQRWHQGTPCPLPHPELPLPPLPRDCEAPASASRRQPSGQPWFGATRYQKEATRSFLGSVPISAGEVGLGDLEVFSNLSNFVILLSQQEHAPAQADGKAKPVAAGDAL